MANKNVLEIIESNYDVKLLQLADGTPIWPFIRQAIYFQIQQKTVQYSNKLRTRNKLLLLKNFFYGIRHLFRIKKYSYFFFGNTNKREAINGRYFDIYHDAWSDIVGQNKSLFIEWAIESHLPEKTVHSTNVISDLPFLLKTKIAALFMRVEINNKNIIDAILSDYGISFNVENELKNKLAEYKVYRKIFKKAKPKAIFVLSSFTKSGIVYAAKRLGIAVYEPQHGFMGSTHPFYNAVCKFPDFYPDKLISFGASEKLANAPSFIFEPEAVIPVGSLQLDLVKKRPVPESLKKAQASYKKLFCVTLQAIKDEAVLGWIENQAKKQPEWLFIVRPKQPNFNLQLYTSVTNVILMPEVSTYDVLKASDYNITIFSTTVIEGIYLGAKPILYNVDDLPKKYFDLQHSDIALIENNEPITETHLAMKGTFPVPYFVTDYFKNVKEAASCF